MSLKSDQKLKTHKHSLDDGPSLVSTTRPGKNKTKQNKMSNVLARTALTTTRLFQLPPAHPAQSPKLAVSKEYRDGRNKTKIETESLSNNLRETLLPLRHPNIVTLRRVDVSSDSSIHLTSDFVEDAGDLHNILQTRLRSGMFLNEKEIFRIFVQVSCVVSLFLCFSLCFSSIFFSFSFGDD